MPAGDAQRTWFPEMVESLRQNWRVDMTFDELIGLAANLDGMLHRLRPQRKIANPIMYCPKCGHVGPVLEPRVTVRATIMALSRFGIASVEEMKELDRRWAAHRKSRGLDLYGQQAQASIQSAKCGHNDGD